VQSQIQAASLEFYITNVIDYDYLPLAHYVESNHDYNHDYICLKTSSERKQKSKTHLHGLM